MIIKVDCHNKNKSIYKCDMCFKTLNVNEVVSKIYVKKIEEKQPKKIWDLCSDCYKSFQDWRTN